jgi:hypothetical protein
MRALGFSLCLMVRADQRRNVALAQMPRPLFAATPGNDGWCRAVFERFGCGVESQMF